MDFTAQVAAIDHAALTGPVRSMLGSATAEIETWEHDLLYGGIGVAFGISAVYRMTGTAREGDATRPWTLVLKILRDPTHGSGPGESRGEAGWDREALIAPGLYRMEAGLRLRYEITRELAPYIGYSYEAFTGGAAGLSRRLGEKPSQSTIVAGIRIFF